MNRRNKPPRFALTFGLDIPTDLAALYEMDSAALDAVETIVDDLAYGRVSGKLLGIRHVSGDLTGLARVKFDVAGQKPQRFRLIYRQVDAHTRHVVAIGVRDEHAIYRAAAERVSAASEGRGRAARRSQ